MFRPPARLVRKIWVRASETLGEVISSDYRSADNRHQRQRLRPHQRLLPRRPGRTGVRQVHRRRGEGRRPGTGRVLPRGQRSGRREGPEGQEPVGPPVEARAGYLKGGPGLVRSGPFSCPYSPECVEGEFCELRLTLEAVGSRHPRRWNAAGAPPGSSTLLPPLRRFAGIVLPTRRSARRMSPAPLTPALETNASTMPTGRGA